MNSRLALLLAATVYVWTALFGIQRDLCRGEGVSFLLFIALCLFRVDVGDWKDVDPIKLKVNSSK